MFRTILAVTGPGFGNGDITLVASLCEQVGAHLSVLVAGLAAPLPFIGAEAVSDAWYEEREDDLKRLRARTAAVSALLADSPLSVDISSEYSELVWSDESIGRRARYADLTVVGPDVLAGETLKEKAVEGALFSSGKPLLLVPQGSSPTLKPKRVLVGWDSSLEASRAVRESLELLKGAESVHVVLVDPIEGENGQGAEPGADVAAYLARHGVKVTVERLPRLNRSIADALRRHAIDTSAELMVIGAYGHSRLRERILGGVTRSMLEDRSIPVLMAR